MTVTTLSVQGRTQAWLGRAFDVVELTKPRIGLLVLATVATAAYLASWGQPDLWRMLHAVIGTSLVAASASAWNQVLERDRDRRMPRTRLRPLADGRLGVATAAVGATLALLAGTGYLAWSVGSAAAAWALASWLLYVAVYTPLKSRTSWNTFVGAIAGAMPVLIGWSAAGAPLDLRAAGLFLVVFLWQFPHFMAIAWMYRREYDQAGLRMLTVVDPSGRRAAVQAVLGAAALLPVSVVPALDLPTVGATLYMLAALLLGSFQLALAVRFFVLRSHESARSLLRVTLVYLPSLLVWLMVCPLA